MSKLSHIKIISAGAGSGKTYRLTHELTALIKSGVRPSGVIATTFTNKAAAELRERVVAELLKEGMTLEAQEVSTALIGTVHSIGIRLLRRFAFFAGVSPQVNILPDDEQQTIFNKAIVLSVTEARIEKLEILSEKLGLNSSIQSYNWRKDIKSISEQARINDFSIDTLQDCKQKSLDSFFEFFGQPDPNGQKLDDQLQSEIKLTRNALTNSDDETKTTQKVILLLNQIEKKWDLNGYIAWSDWAKMAIAKPAKKSNDLVEPLKVAAAAHDIHPRLRQDVTDFISLIFDMASEAIAEYQLYKSRRGLIDYTDMEVHLRELFKNKHVTDILSQEIDLLMVDEFQDTSPIQLDIFWRLSQIARQSVWVGDPKQAIYSFRGAEPELMDGIIDQVGGVKKENILTFSWRSREDIVDFTNVVFSKSFDHLPEERIVLEAKRTLHKDAIGQEQALIHWHLENNEKPNKRPNNSWAFLALAFAIRQWLDGQHLILPKGAPTPRPAIPGDVAILMRSNKEVAGMTDALQLAGLDAAAAGAGLMHTAEAVLIKACFRVLLNDKDTLAIAEVLKYGQGMSLAKILSSREQFLEMDTDLVWEDGVPILAKLRMMRQEIADKTLTEVFDYILEYLNIRRIVKQWLQSRRRLDNIELLRGYALDFENLRQQSNRPATPAGFVIHLNEMADEEKDEKSGGEGPNAINVLTYHKSKGLEWPVVLLGSLHTTLRLNTFGIQIMNDRPQLDMADLLGGRWLRFWINPYGKNEGKTPFIKRFTQSTLHEAIRNKAMEEEARLLYVGITRARDYLIIPYMHKRVEWLNRVAVGDSDLPFITADPIDDGLTWKKKQLPFTYEQYAFGSHFDPIDIVPVATAIPEEKVGIQSYTPYFADVISELPPSGKAFQTGEIITFSKGLFDQSMDSTLDAATVIQEILAGFVIGDSTDENRLRVERILRHFQSEMEVDVVLDYATGFYQEVSRLFGDSPLSKNYLLETKINRQMVSLQLDYRGAIDGVPMVIQHHFSRSNRKGDLTKIAGELGNYFSWVSQAERLVHGRNIPKVYVHLTLYGVLVELTTDSLSE